MKYLIASDIHGSAESCKKMLEWYEEYHCERMILLGDYLYHGPRNDIPGGLCFVYHIWIWHRMQANKFLSQQAKHKDVSPSTLSFVRPCNFRLRP